MGAQMGCYVSITLTSYSILNYLVAIFFAYYSFHTTKSSLRIPFSTTYTQERNTTTGFGETRITTELWFSGRITLHHFFLSMITGLVGTATTSPATKARKLIMANPPETYDGMLIVLPRLWKKWDHKVCFVACCPMVCTHIICLFVF